MEVLPITLTLNEKLILESYKSFVDGLAAYLGAGYEIVIHSLESIEHSVIKIINGYYTGRVEGAPITDFALSILSRIQEQDGNGTSLVYYSTNKSGEPMKSTTILIRGERDRVIGLVCVNFCLNTPFAEVVKQFTPPADAKNGKERVENFVDNVDDLIEAAVNQVRLSVIADTSVAASMKNKAIIHILNDQGIFNLKDSVAKTADLLGISKNTVYLHLRK